MKTPTITQNMALFEANRRNKLEIATRFFDIRLRQLRKEARKKQRQLLWLKLHQLWGRRPACIFKK